MVQRLGNLVLEKFLDGWMSFVDTLQIEHFGKNVPDFYDITRERIALAFVNSHFVTHGTWPRMSLLMLLKKIKEKSGNGMT